jgi:hypothetical protein
MKKNLDIMQESNKRPVVKLLKKLRDQSVKAMFFDYFFAQE